MTQLATPPSPPVLRPTPPSPPRIPWHRQLGRAAHRAWPAVAWCLALAGALWFYSGLTHRGHGVARAQLAEVRASASVAGRVATLSARLGDAVAQGDPIATLDIRDIDARLRFARAKLDRSRTRIAAERAELLLDARDRRAQAAARRTSYEADGRRIRAAIDRLVAGQSADRGEVAALAPQIERLEALADRNLVTVDRLEGLLRSRAVLEARIASNAALLESTRGELAAWEQLEPEPYVETDDRARLVPFELELEAQEARLAELELEREKYTVLAPSAGVVNRISARPGEWVDAGDEIVEIVAAVPSRLTAYLSAIHAHAVVTGTCTTLYPRDREGAALEGRVLEVGPRMELVPRQLRRTPSVPEWGRRVTIAVAGSDAPLPGEVYTARFR